VHAAFARLPSSLPPLRFGARPESLGSVDTMHVLVAADADWLVDEIVAALAGDGVSFTVCSEGRDVSRLVADRAGEDQRFDVGIFDLQIGSMGGMAVTLALRLDESAGVVPHVPVIMLLDRVADVHLARRSGANGWLVKPLDPLRLHRAVTVVVAGGTYREGLDGVEIMVVAPDEPSGDVDSAGAEPLQAG
jgi:DNA-binding response OmpR family regulator